MHGTAAQQQSSLVDTRQPSVTGGEASQGWVKPAASREAGSRIAARMRSYSWHTSCSTGRSTGAVSVSTGATHARCVAARA